MDSGDGHSRLRSQRPNCTGLGLGRTYFEIPTATLVVARVSAAGSPLVLTRAAVGAEGATSTRQAVTPSQAETELTAVLAAIQPHPFPDERIALLKEFAFLKSMRLVPAKEPFTPETQAKIKALLPKTDIQFK